MSSGQFDQVVKHPLRAGQPVVVARHVEFDGTLPLGQCLDEPPAQVKIRANHGAQLPHLKCDDKAGGDRFGGAGVAASPEQLTQAENLLGLRQLDDFLSLVAQNRRPLHGTADQ